jgi:hypothetical protein
MLFKNQNLFFTVGCKLLWIFFLAILSSHPDLLNAQCAKAGPNNGSNFTTDNSNSGSYVFSNPAFVQFADNNFASASSIIGLFTRKTCYLKATGFNFHIPATADICGVEVEIERKATGLILTAAVSDDEVKLVKGGTITGLNKKKSITWPSSDTYTTYGSSNDLWGTTLTPAEVNDPNFGVIISANITSLISVAPSADIDHIRMSVYYNVPLPVTLEYFHASLSRNIANLEWKMDFFNENSVTVQRSADAVSWNDIKVYDVSGLNTSRIFKYDDELSNPGKYYYRLMFTSAANGHEYSPVRSVTFQPGTSSKIFPVPSHSFVFLSDATEHGKIIVTDISGKIIDVPADKISNQLIRLNISSLRNGLYFVHAGNLVQQIIKE